MSFGRNSVNWGAPPAPAVPTPASGPTLFSVTVGNGPAAAGSDVDQVPIVQSDPLALVLPACERVPPAARLTPPAPPPARPPPALVVPAPPPPVDASPPVAGAPPTAVLPPVPSLPPTDALPPVSSAPPLDGDPPTLLKPPVVAADPPEEMGVGEVPPVEVALLVGAVPPALTTCEAPPEAELLPPI